MSDSPEGDQRRKSKTKKDSIKKDKNNKDHKDPDRKKSKSKSKNKEIDKSDIKKSKGKDDPKKKSGSLKKDKKLDGSRKEGEEKKEDGKMIAIKNYKIHDNYVDDLCQDDNVERKVGKEDFDLMAVIGVGTFGKVMQVKHKKSDKVFAMKVMRKNAIIEKDQVTHARDEKHVLQKIQHPFIVNLHYAFQTKDKLYMIMDFINGGELFFHLKRETKFSEARVIFYAAEIACALIHLHNHGIVYRDLKPENILLDSKGHIIITDFGLSKEIFDDYADTFCGTPEYLSPEVLRGHRHSYPVDWWSLGTLIYEMLLGYPPFYAKNINVMYQRILESPLRFPEGLSQDAMDILDKLLDRDPKNRLCGPTIRDHPFFKSIDWDLLEAKKIEPPWKPPVSSETDIGNFDKYFTTQIPQDSLVVGPSWLDAIDDEDKDLFEGFTFIGQNTLEGQSESE